MSVLAEPKPQRDDARLPLWRQLRWSLALMFLLLVVVPISVIAYITFTQVRDTAEEQTINQLESVAELKAQAIDRWIATSQESLDLILASNTNINGFEVVIEQRGDPGGAAFTYRQLNEMLASAAASHQGVEEYFFYDLDEGQVLVASDATRINQNVRRKPYFTSSLVGPYVQSPFYEITGELVMVVTTPVQDSTGAIIGVLAARLNLDTLTEIMLERAGLGDTGETYLISAQSSFLLTASRFEDFSQNTAYHSYGIDRALQNIDGAGLYEDYRGETVFGVYRWNDELQSALLAEIDESEALQDYNATQNLIAVVVVVLGLAAVAVGVFVATRFSNPIVALTRTASRLAGGDLSVRARTRQRNEVGVLARVFNDMAEQLQTMVGSLESRVEARTRDLFLTLEVGQLATHIYQQEDLLPLITEYIRQQFGLYYTQVYLIDDAQRYAVLSSGTGEVGTQLLARNHRLDLRETSIVARTVQTQRPVLVANTDISDIFKPNPLLPETRSEVAIPLIVGDEVIGVLDMQATEADTFRDDNLPVFEAMASQLASALRSAQAYAQTQAAIARATAINRRLTTQTWESYLGRVGAGERVGYRYDLQHVEPLKPSEEVTGSGGNGNESALQRAVKLRDQVIGHIALSDDENRQWTPEELALIDDVADRVAQALDQFRAFDDTRSALDRVDLIMGAAGEGIYGLDRDGNVTFVNAAASALDGFEPGELIGQNHHTLMHHTRRDGTPYPEEECPVYRTLQDGQPRRSENELFWRKDGTSYPVEVTANPIIQDGEVVGVVVNFDDITERIEAQSERERLLRETEEQAVRLAMLNDMATEMSTAETLNDVYRIAARFTNRILRSDRSSIALLTPEGDGFEIFGLDGVEGAIPMGAKLPVNGTFIGTIVRGRQLVNQDMADPAVADFPEVKQLSAQGLRTSMNVPLLIGEDVLGTLNVASTHPNAYDTRDEGLLVQIASLLSSHIETHRLLDETRRRASEMETVAQVGTQAAASLDVEQLLWEVAELTKARFDLYHAHIYLLDEANETLILRAGAGQPGRRMVDAGHRIALSHERSLVARAARTREAVVVDDVTAAADFLPNPLLPETRSEMAIPMVVGDQLIGVLDVQAARVGRFTGEDVRVQGTLASQIAVSINNARLFAETERLLADSQRRASEMETVSQVGAEAAASLDPDRLLRDVADLTKERFGLYHAHIYLINDSGELLVLAAGAGEVGQMMVQRGHSIPLNRATSIVARAAREGKAVVVDDVTLAEDFLPNPLLPRTRSEMAIPMIVGEQVIGVLDVQSEQTNRFDDEDVRVKTTLASQVAVAVNNARLFNETQLRVRDLRILNEVAEHLRDETDLDTMLETIVGIVVDALGGDNAIISNLYHDTREWRGWIGAGAGMTSEIAQQFVDPAENYPFGVDAAERDEVIAIDDSFTYPGFPVHIRDAIGVQSVIAIPIHRTESYTSVLYINYVSAPHSFSPEEIALAEGIADQLAGGIERRRAGLELENQRRTLETLLANLPVGVFMAEVPSGRPLLTNEAAEAMLGRGISPGIGSDELAEVYEAYVAGSEDLYPTTQMPLVRGMAGERAQIDNMEIRRPDGSRLLLSVAGAPIQDAEGNITASVAVFSDITERRQAELERELLLDQVQRRAAEMETVAQVGAEASASLDTGRLLNDVVNLTKERFGLYHVHIYLLDESEAALVLTAGAGRPGQLMLERGHSIPLAREGSLVARAARSQVPVVVNDVRQADDFLPNPLLPRTRSEMAIPMVVGGEVIGVLDVQADQVDAFDDQEVQVLSTLAGQIAVSVQNARLFAEQVQVAEQLREVDRLKSEFLASMSHELRTPLNSIIGYAEVLLDGIDGDLTDDMEEDVGAIHGSGKHLLNLINDILDLAKIEAGQMDLVSEALALRPLVEDMANTSRVLVKNKEVELVVDIPDDLPLVQADPLRVRQVVNNLVSNAAKFTEEGSITIWAKPYEDDPDYIHIGVTDTGIGMSQDQLDVIFDRFRQVDQSHTRRAGGTGLGLSITLQLIEMHGGQVWVESEPGVGSTFHFTLPRAKVKTAPAGAD